MADDGSVKIEKGELAFPYVDLDGAIKVARAILDKGGVALERDQLAAALGLIPRSGNFSIQLGAARHFGLVENSGGKNGLTALGYEILDPSRAANAKAKAFLNVPLYKRAYDEYRGKQLPPRPHGLENAFVSFGVAPKQKDKARHVFDRSARIAGFFPTPAEDRLVAPPMSDEPDAGGPTGDSSAMTPSAPTPPPAPKRNLHPFIEGLLEEIPDRGQPWPQDVRKQWLQTAASIFDLMYRADGQPKQE